MNELAAGSVVAGRLRLERKIGEGGMGEVWAAIHLITRKPVALKVLKPEATRRQDLVRRFFREARAASAVRHPNVVTVHDVLEHEGAPVMVMDLLEGESLADRLERQGHLTLAEFAALMVPAMGAVAAAHAVGVVHRDLKPENIFLAQNEGDSMVPKVLDFGIAKLSLLEGEGMHTAALTRTGSMMGTPYYMAPEQAFGEKDVDWRVDVWALGVIAYECLSGRRPFEGDNFGQVFKAVTTSVPPALGTLCPMLPHEVTDLVTSMLSRQRERRPELNEVLGVFSTHTGVEAPSWTGPSGAMTIRHVRDHAATVAVAASVRPLSSPPGAERADTVAVPALAGGGIGETVARTALSPGIERPGEPRRRSRRGLWIGLGSAAVGATALTAWAITSSSLTTAPTREPETSAPPKTEAPPPPPTPPEVSPNTEPAESAPLDAGRALEQPPAPTPVKGAPRTKAAAKTAATGSEQAPTGPKKLPGGILDQEKAPF